MYRIKLRQPMDIIRQAMAREQDFTIRLDTEHSLAYAAMAIKNYYHRSRTYIRKWFEPGDYVYLRLGHRYDIQANQDLLIVKARPTLRRQVQSH